MAFADGDLTTDGFLAGRLQVRQPKSGYRAATDPVLLAAAVLATAGQTVLDLGCGAGVAALCLGRRVAGLTLAGVEIQPDYAALAMRNAHENNIPLAVYCADLARLPVAVTAQSFDHVIANPPYLAQGAGTGARDHGRETAFREDTPLSVWLDVAIRRLKPRGTLSVIHLAARLPDLLAGLDARVGSIEIKPVAARAGRDAGRILLRARKGGRGALVLHPALVVHRGHHHDADEESYTREMQTILRDGSGLSF